MSNAADECNYETIIYPTNWTPIQWQLFAEEYYAGNIKIIKKEGEHASTADSSRSTN